MFRDIKFDSFNILFNTLKNKICITIKNINLCKINNN